METSARRFGASIECASTLDASHPYSEELRRVGSGAAIPFCARGCWNAMCASGLLAGLGIRNRSVFEIDALCAAMTGGGPPTTRLNMVARQDQALQITTRGIS